MDRKGIFILVVCFGLLIAWPQFVNKFFPPKPLPPRASEDAKAAEAAGAGELSPPLEDAAPVPQPPVAEVAEDLPEELLSLETGESRYTFTSQHGGIKLVELKSYPASRGCDDEEAAAGQLVSLNTNAPLPMLTLIGEGPFAGGRAYRLTRTNDRVVAEKELPGGLVVVKEFRPTGTNYVLEARLRIENRSEAAVGLPQRQLVVGTASDVAPGGDPMFKGVYYAHGDDVSDIQSGAFANRVMGCGPSRPIYRFAKSPEAGISWLAVHNQFFTVITIPEKPAGQMTVEQLTPAPFRRPSGGDESAATNPWLLEAGDFKNFGAVVYALTNPGENAFAKYLYDLLPAGARQAVDRFNARNAIDPADQALLLSGLNQLLKERAFYQDNKYFFSDAIRIAELRNLVERDALSRNQRIRLNRLLFDQAFLRAMQPPSPGYQASLVYPAKVLAPGEAVEYSFNIYAGPREYRGLTRLSSTLETNIDAIMDFGGFFGFFSKALLLSMNSLHNLGITYGWSIVVITIIIKLLFWPLTQSSTRSMKRMAKLQPQMKEIQTEYKDDPKKMNQKMMQFMRENKVNPLGSCLPILIQMPVFFGFFFMIKSAIELRGASFLWACDLSSSDTIFTIPGLGWIPFLGIQGVGFPVNPMPILMAVSMIYQMSLTPPSPGMDPTQQKLMRMMPIFFVFILYNYSAGLTLYWTVNNVLSILQTKLIRSEDVQVKGGAGKPAARAANVNPELMPKKGTSARKGLPGQARKKKKKKNNDPHSR